MKVPLRTLLQMYYQHQGTPTHYARNITQYLNEQFPDRWIGCGGPQNWPPRSPDISPLDLHVWGYMEDMVNERKLDTRLITLANFRCWKTL